MDHRKLSRVKRSPIWLCTSEFFAALIAKSDSFMDALRHFGLVSSGNSVKCIKRRCIVDGISTDHFDSGNKRRASTLRGKANAMPLESILVVGSTYNRGCLKRRVINSGLIKNQCAICGNPPAWNGKPMVLILDHENGANNDNRPENLRLVCPNCNSQLPTFSGRNRDFTRKHCTDCGRVVRDKKSIRCQGCSSLDTHRRGHTRKITWPSYEILEAMISSSNRLQVSKKLGVSETAVRKMLKRMRSSTALRPASSSASGTPPLER